MLFNRVRTNLVLCMLGIIVLPGMMAQGSVKLLALNSLERIQQHQAPFGKEQAEIEAARNEVESFQIVVAAVGQSIKVSTLTLTELVAPDGSKIGGDNIKLYREEFVRVRKSTVRNELPPGLYPDPLVPFINPLTGEAIVPLHQKSARWGEPTVTVGYDMYALPFEVYADYNQPIWVDIHVPEDAVPGTYKGVVKVVSNGGKAEMPVTLTVWDFVLPKGPTHSSHFGSFWGVARTHNVKADSKEFRDIVMNYCKMHSDHRINPPIPNNLLPVVNKDGSLTIVAERDKELQAFMRDLNVTDFEMAPARFAALPSSTLGDNYKTITPENREKALRYYRDYYKYLKTNGWEKRAYVYLHDEPNTKENYEQVLVKAAVVHEAVPELKCLVVEQTYLQDPTWPDMDEGIDIWCPLWAFIDRDSINQKIKNGDQVWSYTALAQRTPRYHPHYEQLKDKDPPYWHIDRPLMSYRVPTWINRQYNITGLLYWSSIQRVLDAWNLPAFTHPGHFNGGGFLMYPGVPCGIDGPVASMRLKGIRDSLEDYEYFVLLEQKVGADAVKKIVDKVAPEWWEYTRDPEVLLAARREIAQAILAK